MALPELTKNEKLVLAAISEAGKPVSAYDILDNIRPHGVRSPVQVYRAIKKLVQNGAVHKIESLNSFVLCAGSHVHLRGSAILAVCERCGRVTEFCDHDVDLRLAEWARRNNFQIGTTSLELSGLCEKCLAKPTKVP